MNDQYQTKDFYGSVLLKDWITDLKDRQVRRITGTCSLVRDEDYVGFKTRGTESNWAIRVVGGSQQWTILGCQIRAVVTHSREESLTPDGATIL